uniref:protocadherin Fat 1-like isoform X2 n=1 Tax=Myxine glutinosa TaxID=7769 RepID=UPI00358E6C03
MEPALPALKQQQLLLLLLLILAGHTQSSRTETIDLPSLQFTYPVYNATIYENSAVKSYVESWIKMGIHLNDSTWDLKYKVISGDGNNFKAEGHVVGDFCFLRLRTKRVKLAMLNREVQDKYVVTVKAVLKGWNIEAWTKVLVQVLDTNDLRPLFSPTSYSAKISEDAPIRSIVTTVTATDADIGKNGEFYYSIAEQTDLFAVHPTSGDVWLTGKLDFSRTRTHTLTIIAMDRGTKLYGSGGAHGGAQLTIYVQEPNRHAPVVTVVSQMLSGEEGNLYAVVTVEDEDTGKGGIISSLTILDGDPLQEFYVARSTVDENTFLIKAVGEPRWDSYAYGYNLSVQASDGGSPTIFSPIHVININSVFHRRAAVHFEKKVYSVELGELSPPNTQVVLVKASSLSPNFNFRIRSHDDEKGLFTIGPRSGLVTLVGKLNRIGKNQTEVEIGTDVDESFTRVKVKIVDENDHAPRFQYSSYKATVSENVVIGTSVISVLATDADEGENGYITYSISNIVSMPFAIDPFTGIVSTSQELDYELMARAYNLRVRASDWGSPFRRETEVLVSITLNNINDQWPVFEQINCTGFVARDASIGETVATVSAIDGDELQLVRYEIHSGNEQGMFSLDSTSGMLFIRQPLSNSPRHAYYLQIAATDGDFWAKPLTVNLTVEDSRHNPAEIHCQNTGIAAVVAKALFHASKLKNMMGMEELFEDGHSINRHAPHFINSVESVVMVREDVAVDSVLFQVSAEDEDGGFNGMIKYVISGGNDGHFTINSETGSVQVLLPLDYEIRDLHVINVTAFDLGMPQKTSSKIMTVHVLDVNDNKPTFLESSYAVTIREDARPGKHIIRIEAVDTDSLDYGTVRYQLNTHTDQFAIDEKLGIIRITRSLDRELIPFYELEVEAYDSAEEEKMLSSSVIVEVNIDDVNDNRPKFTPNTYSVRLREDVPVGSVVVFLEAWDPDVGSGGEVRYSLLESVNGMFEVDRLSGTVRIAQPLDYETRQFYNLTARAQDGGRPVSLSSTCQLTVEVVDVDENYYSPEFQHFALASGIKEDAPPGSMVVTVSAMDMDNGRDGRVKYFLHDGSGLGMFTINSDTGEIVTAGWLDSESSTGYWLHVIATDGGVVPRSSSLHLYVEVENVNDNAPCADEVVYRPRVPENAPHGTPVLRLQAQDPDVKSNEWPIFHISGGDPQGFFSIDKHTGQIATTSRTLDRERQAEHVLEVTIADQDMPSLSSTVWVIVTVVDENDNEPRFRERVYNARLLERARSKRREHLYQIIASDIDLGANADLSYLIVDGNEQGYFFIDPVTGIISTAHALQAGRYDILTIKVVDNGRPQKFAKARLHMKWMARPALPAEPLRFDKPKISLVVHESESIGSALMELKSSGGGTFKWYTITRGNEACQFDVHRESGMLIIAKGLDAESLNRYNLSVEVTDGLSTATVQVHIQLSDYNDNRAEFSQKLYKAVISEAVPTGTKVLQIAARDPDRNARLIFTIYSSLSLESSGLFHLHAGTGVLRTASSLVHIAQREHILTVMVRDQGVHAKRNLVRVIVQVVDSNDHAPKFLQSLYKRQVFESAALGSAVLQVTATDKDKGANAEISYSIKSGNGSGHFAIDPLLGTISVTKQLDSFVASHYGLVVKATDRGSPSLSSETNVHIEVTVSDNASPRFASPKYSATISESAGLGASVCLLSATSRSSVIYVIATGNIGQVFDLNPSTGFLTTKKPLDYEEMSSYILTVKAINMAGQSNDVPVSVHVIDANDHAPVFKQHEYSGLVSEIALPGSVLLDDKGLPLVVRASDADTNRNSVVFHHIVEPSARKFFNIHLTTGTIRLAKSLDHEMQSIYHFNVRAHDNGNPRRSAEKLAHVTVHVIDINDCRPMFAQSSYTARLLFPTYKGVEVLGVSAIDRDVGSHLAYSITGGNIGTKFAINAENGVITVNSTSELARRYEIAVNVTDGKFSENTTVTIITKQNSNSGLAFRQSLYYGSVLENSTQRQVVALILAVGTQPNEPLVYRVLNPERRFEIGRTSGALRTTGVPFDREEKDFYSVVVEVRSLQNAERVANILVQVDIQDANDNTPVFVGLPYYAIIGSNSKIGAFIKKIQVTDQDVGRNGEVFFSLDYDYGHFEIDANAGNITLTKPFLNSESLKEFVLHVIATDAGNSPLSAMAEVRVILANGKTPMFENPFLSAHVDEDVQMHTPVLNIQAHNPSGNRLVYFLANGSENHGFSVDLNTGVLSISNKLDNEKRSRQQLLLCAADLITGVHAEMAVDIWIDDVNDNVPRFLQNSYSAVLSEAVGVGTSVFTVTATDVDSGSNGAVLYDVEDENGQNTEWFTIDPNSGLVLTAQQLDREKIAIHRFYVKATDGGSPALTSKVPVTITLQDFNDNPPHFDRPLYQESLSELATRGHFVTRVVGYDEDISNSDKLTYMIISGNEDSYFGLDSKTGVIRVASFHRQSMHPSYTLNVSVSDGVYVSTTEVDIKILHEDLHSPVFSQYVYVVEFSENTPVGTIVTEVTVGDEDEGYYGEVEFLIIGDFAASRFSVDSDGRIVSSEELDREDSFGRVIDIHIMAKDRGGRVAFCLVKVILTDENDNAPRFMATEYQASIPADAVKGTFVVKINAEDADEGTNADIVYSIHEEMSNYIDRRFAIDEDTGVISVAGDLADMEKKVVSFFVKATDKGIHAQQSTVPVSIIVLPSGSLLPAFDESLYSFTISEDHPVGTMFGSVHASSAHQLSYSLVRGSTIESNKDGNFFIDTKSGQLLLTKPVDFEITKWYQFIVVATSDSDATALVEVSVRVEDSNDNAPVFESSFYEGFVMENLPSGISIVQLKAKDVDAGANGQVLYSLDHGTESGGNDVAQIFTLDAETGWLTTRVSLDREAHAKYQFNVVAKDLGHKAKLTTSVVLVTVMDANDQPPQFSAEVYKGTVWEDAQVGDVVAILSIHDADSASHNSQATLHLEDGDPLGQFALEPTQDGWKVFVKKALDREIRESYLLNVTASDGLHTSQALVDVEVLDINDNPPECEQALYEELLSEDVPPSTRVLQVHARDADLGENGRLHYSLHGSRAFSVDSDTGLIRTAAPLDREQQAEYRMYVRVSDTGGLACEMQLHLSVQDVNDNPPAFSAPRYSVAVYENTAVGTPVGCVSATDADSGENGHITYYLEPTNAQFSMDKTTGLLTLRKHLHRQMLSEYSLRVCAKDNGSLALLAFAPLTVTVLDVNDNPPVFEFSEYGGSVLEDAPIGTVVLTVYAASREAAGRGAVTYTIGGGNEDGKFHIDAGSGEIAVAGELDYETRQEFFLTVEACDSTALHLCALATVALNISDVNDHEPKFRRPTYTAVLREDSPPGKHMITVEADDGDNPKNSHVMYTIVRGNVGNKFQIHPSTGRIILSEPLDHEQVSGYSLLVRATDSGVPVRSADVILSIDVSDVNDNPPRFSRDNYSVVVQENRPAGSPVLQLLVSDLDSRHNGPPFKFSIISGNEAGAFLLHASGEIRTARVLGTQHRGVHTLVVQVTDSGQPPLSATTHVQLHIVQESVHPPSVVPLEVRIIAVPGSFPGGVIGKIHATDLDVHDTLTYALTRPQQPFLLGATDGKLVASGSLLPGTYRLAVQVTDGHFSTVVDVTVHVSTVPANVSRETLTIRFIDVAPEEFVAGYLHNFQRLLSRLLSTRRQHLRLLSLQPSSLNNLDVLFTIDGSGARREDLLAKLNSSLSELEQLVGLRPVAVFDWLCEGLTCPRSCCCETLSLDGAVWATYSTARLSLVTSQHRRSSTCQCKEACKLETRAPETRGTFAFTFNGNSYLRYELQKEMLGEMTLSLHFRTRQMAAVLMHAGDPAYAVLEIVQGELRFTFDWGSGPGEARLAEQVSDGSWHSLVLDLRGNTVHLVLDGQHEASGKAPGALNTLSLDSSLFFGAQVYKSPNGERVELGLQGCLQLLQLSSAAAVSQPAEVVGTMRGCQEPGESICTGEPCQNGGSCTIGHHGGFRCVCPKPFVGALCEISSNPCASRPCLFGGRCVQRGASFTCLCHGGYTGKRCQIGPFCRENPCGNNGKCVDRLDDAICQCPTGYMGNRCEMDVDECEESPCRHDAHCQNSYGSFSCNCSDGFSGPVCEYPGHDTTRGWLASGPVGLVALVGLLVLLLLLMVVFVFVSYRIHRCRHACQPEKHDLPPIPPVPVRPASYTPSIPSDSRNNLEQSSYDFPEFSTFGTDSTRGRRAVAVCSVAPNLPPPPPSNSDCDSIGKGMWEFDCETKPADSDCVLEKQSGPGAACFSPTPHGTLSSQHSFNSDNCDENGYHWDTSDWLPIEKLHDIEEEMHFVAAPPRTFPDATFDLDYYPGGYDVDGDFPPAPDADIIGPGSFTESCNLDMQEPDQVAFSSSPALCRACSPTLDNLAVGSGSCSDVSTYSKSGMTPPGSLRIAEDVSGMAEPMDHKTHTMV